MKPYIGINCKYIDEEDTSYYKLDKYYIEAVRKAGGVPIILPLFSAKEECWETLDKIDGLLLTGGADINPARWHEPKHNKTKLLHKDKESSDFILADSALKRDMPIFGICYGHQLINTILGGTLHQHIPDINGCIDHSDGKMHGIKIEADSRLNEILGIEKTKVNSYHHQAIKTLGKGLIKTAVSEDGVIEAAESQKHRFLITVQWHPERMIKSPDQFKLLETFIKATM